MTRTKRILALFPGSGADVRYPAFFCFCGEITISDSSGDVPVLYAQDPFNTVKSEVEGGTNYMTSVGGYP